MNKEVEWLPHLDNSLPTGIHGYTVGMYCVALEGWRRGLSLRFHNNSNNKLKVHTRFTLSSKEREYKFSVTRANVVSRKAINTCIDKNLTKKALKKANVPIPEGSRFKEDANDQEIIGYADSIEYPLVIKPTNGAGGEGVIAGIKDQLEFENALQYVKYELNYKDIIVEKFFDGEDYRLYVIGDKVIGAIKRIPANVVGDGILTIRELIKEKQKERYKNPIFKKRPFVIDQELHNMLTKQNYKINSVPNKGETVFLKTTCNISTGGDPIDATEDLSDEVKEIAIKASKAIPGLLQCGVDMMIKNNKGVVIEVNSKPSIRTHLFPIEGKARDVPKAIIDYYFPESKANHDEPLYYFEFQCIWDIFKDGIAKEYLVPKAPQGQLKAIQFIVFGFLQQTNYFQWVQRKARDLDLNGYIKEINKNELEVVISGNITAVNHFRTIINNSTSQKTTVNKVVENKWQFPVKVGFEIFKDTKSLKSNLKVNNNEHKKDDSKRNQNKSDNYKEKYEKILNSNSWKLTKPLRKIGEIKKKLFKVR